MKNEKYIKVAIALSVIIFLILGLGRQRIPKGYDANGICGVWRYQNDSDEHSQEWYLNICESGSGMKCDFNIYEAISEEPLFSGYVVLDSHNEMTVYYKDDEEFELPEAWEKTGKVQKFSYEIKNKLFSQDELYITYEDNITNFTLIFTKEE